MRYTVQTVICVILALMAFTSRAEDIPGSCMVSFNVQQKGFALGNATVSCRLLEARRVDLSQQISDTAVTGDINGSAVAQKLDALHAEITKQQQSKNWVALGATVTGSALATLGLAACLETSGAGCLLAAVGKIMSIYSLFDAASSESDKAGQASTLRSLVADARKDVVGKKSAAKSARDKMITDAIAMCTAVKASCL